MNKSKGKLYLYTCILFLPAVPTPLHLCNECFVLLNYSRCKLHFLEAVLFESQMSYFIKIAEENLQVLGRFSTAK